MMGKYLILEKHKIQDYRVQNHTVFQTKMAKIDTLSMTKTAKKHPLGHIPVEPL